MKPKITLGLMMAILFLSTSTTAQVKEARFGHINAQAIIESMPERQQIEDEINAVASQYQEELQRMNGEVEAKFMEYQEKADSWPSAIRAQKEQEITQDQQGLQQFAATVDQELALLQQERFAPMVAKVEKAIQEVAEENGFSYIFEEQVVLYFGGGEDIAPLVKAKLGL